jgi:hypothetical protein
MHYSFPSVERLAQIPEEELRELGFGYFSVAVMPECIHGHMSAVARLCLCIDTAQRLAL